MERSRAALGWATDNLAQIRAVCVDYELALVGLIWDYWVAHKESPSYKIIYEMAQQVEKNEGMMEALGEYESLQSDLTRHDAPDLSQILKEKTDEYELARLNAVMERVKRIANGAVEDKKTKKRLSGTGDAVTYFLGQLSDGLITSKQKSRGGDLKATLRDAPEDYAKTERASRAGSLTIRTGLDKLDRLIGGIRRQEMTGILGFAGTRKSTVARSILYNAACQGFRSVHVSLEHSFEEERTMYLIMHAHHPKFGGKFKVSKRAYDDGILSEAEKEYLFGEVTDDFVESTPGTIICKQPVTPTWEEIKALAEYENKIAPVDLLLVDYLSLVKTFSRNPKDEIEAIIRDAKQWAFSFNNGVGIALLTPIQGNREGYEEAGKREGRWDKDGIYMYSEFDKTCDIIMYTYIDDTLKGQNKMQIGTCKSRRSDDCPPLFYSVSAASGKVTNDADTQSLTPEQKADDALDCL